MVGVRIGQTTNFVKHKVVQTCLSNVILPSYLQHSSLLLMSNSCVSKSTAPILGHTNCLNFEDVVAFGYIIESSINTLQQSKNLASHMVSITVCDNHHGS